MQNGQERDFTALIAIWADAWAKEKGMQMDWVEHTVAGVNRHSRWSMLASHVQSKSYGLSFQLQSISENSTAEATMDSSSTGAETTSPAVEASSYPCVMDELISITAARKMQADAEELVHTMTLTGNIVICLNKKSESHKKHVRAVQDVLADLQRYAALEDEAVISAQNKEILVANMSRFSVTGDKVSFVLPKIDKKVDQVAAATQPTGAALSTPTPPQNAGILDLLGLGGRQAKGAPGSAAVANPGEVAAPSNSM